MIRRIFIRRRLFAGVLAVFLAAIATGARAATSAPAFSDSNQPALMPDSQQLWALGMIETGNNDREIGGVGEVSRYQILPAIWKMYTASKDYSNPELAEKVARAHWAYLANYYQSRTGRAPCDFDMYVMWNTSLGYYARKDFDPHRISNVVQDRARRFVNLVNRRS